MEYNLFLSENKHFSVHNEKDIHFLQIYPLQTLHPAIDQNLLYLESDLSSKNILLDILQIF